MGDRSGLSSRLQPEGSRGRRPGPQGLAGALQGRQGLGRAGGGPRCCGLFSSTRPRINSTDARAAAWTAARPRPVPPGALVFQRLASGQAFLKQEDKYIKYVASYLRWVILF